MYLGFFRLDAWKPALLLAVSEKCASEVSKSGKSPLTWKKPRRIFVCPRADLFHPDVPAKFIADIFGVMAASPQHTFQVLTKRAYRAQTLLRFGGFKDAVEDCMAMYSDAPLTWPLPNVWLGVSIEDQATADERIPLLLETPAALRWVSAEPLLGAVDLTPAYLPCPNALDGLLMDRETGAYECCRACDYTGIGSEMGIDWLVAGGESGPNAREMNPTWPRALRDQCQAAGVPFLFKQWGPYAPMQRGDDWGSGDIMIHGGKRTGRLLDGVLHDAYPEVRHA